LPVARTLHTLAVRGALATERALDATDRSRPARLDRVTLMVKTFERPQVAARLVRSVHRRYPGLPVVVADDSRRPAEIPGTRLVALPFDSGVGAGRQAALAAVDTELVLVVDDDMVFNRHSRMELALATIDAHPGIDVVAGRVVNLPRYRNLAYPAVQGRRIGGLPVLEKVPTFYLARTARLRLVGWDPALKRLDHGDFFLRARGVLTVVQDERIRVLHARTPYDRAYMEHRLALDEDRRILRERWS
jgi:hypothetical protein